MREYTPQHHPQRILRKRVWGVKKIILKIWAMLCELNSVVFWTCYGWNGKNEYLNIKWWCVFEKKKINK